jgi:hypothetical protein
LDYRGGEIKHLILFGILNLVVSTLSGAAGGGGFLSGAPLLILLGLSPAQAVATTRFGGFGISMGASIRFWREKITDKRTVIIFSLLGAACAVIGSLGLLHFRTQSEVLQKLIGLTVLFVAVPSMYIGRTGLKPGHKSRGTRAVGIVLLTIVTILLAAFGSGMGTLQMVILLYFFGMTALVASATRRFMQLVVAAVSLIFYIPSGLVDFPLALTALATSFLGGFAGAHIAIRKGDKFVLNLFAIVSVLLALELIFGEVSR